MHVMTLRPALALALLVLTMFLGTTPRLFAAEEGTYDQLLREIVNLRLDIEQQRREIRALREEVGQMHAKMEGKPYRKSAPVAETPATRPPDAYGDRDPAPVPAPEPKSTTKKAEDEAPAKSSSSANGYKVKSGDTLSSIARAHKVSLDALQTANPGVNPKSLKVGMELKLP